MPAADESIDRTDAVVAVSASFRQARASDIARCIVIRALTRENAVSAVRLAALGITEATWSSQVEGGTLLGHVCECDGRTVAYCFGSAQTAYGFYRHLGWLPTGGKDAHGDDLLRYDCDD